MSPRVCRPDLHCHYLGTQLESAPTERKGTVMKTRLKRIERVAASAARVGITTLRVLGWMILILSTLPLALLSIALFISVLRSKVSAAYRAVVPILLNALLAIKVLLPCAVALIILLLCSIGWWRNCSSRLRRDPGDGMTQNVEGRRVIGVLLVHGIGSQKRGSTTKSFVQGLMRSAGTRILGDYSDSNVRVLATEHTTIRIYEVFWADYLSGPKVKSTFKLFEAQGLAVFPLLNRRAGLFRRTEYRTAWLWTGILTPAAALMIVFYPLLLIPWVRRMLDEVVADVFNYANSAGRALQPNDPLASAADQIVGEFYETLAQASEDGCSELRIVAHSLGTLVTYHAMTGYLLDRPLADSELRYTRDSLPLGLVRRVYTIGSPLSKVRSIWPKLIPTADKKDAASDKRIETATDEWIKARQVNSSAIWYNYYDVLDVIAGRLRDFDLAARVRNHALFFWGGLLEAHTIYTRNPTFLAAVSSDILGEEVQDVHVSILIRAWIFFRAFLLVLGPLLLLAAAVLLLLAFDAFSAGAVAAFIATGPPDPELGGYKALQYSSIETAVKVIFIVFVTVSIASAILIAVGSAIQAHKEWK